MKFKLTDRIPIMFTVYGEHGVEIDVVHYLRELRPTESLRLRRAYMRMVSADDTGRSEAALDLRSTQSELWKDLVQDVEGYEVGEGIEIKEVMPLDHRVAAIESLMVLRLPKTDSTEEGEDTSPLEQTESGTSSPPSSD